VLIIKSNEVPAYRTLSLEYEESLPPDLRHADIDVVPELVLVAYNDGAACGCVGLTMHDDATALMRHLYVPPAFRGLGVARALIDAFIEAARERGCMSILLDTDREQLAPAYALYRSYGFEECEAYGTVDYATPTFMRLAIASAKCRGAEPEKRT